LRLGKFSAIMSLNKLPTPLLCISPSRLMTHRFEEFHLNSLFCVGPQHSPGTWKSLSN
jgi:hypothetical protein